MLNQLAGPDILCWCVPSPQDRCLSTDPANCTACMLSRRGKRTVMGDLAANMTLTLRQLKYWLSTHTFWSYCTWDFKFALTYAQIAQNPGVFFCQEGGWKVGRQPEAEALCPHQIFGAWAAFSANYCLQSKREKGMQTCLWWVYLMNNILWRCSWISCVCYTSNKPDQEQDLPHPFWIPTLPTSQIVILSSLCGQWKKTDFPREHFTWQWHWCSGLRPFWGNPLAAGIQWLAQAPQCMKNLCSALDTPKAHPDLYLVWLLKGRRQNG